MLATIIGMYLFSCLIVFFGHGMSSTNQPRHREKSPAWNYREWQASRVYNDGSLRKAQAERLAAVNLLDNLFYWTRCLYWPLMLPIAIIRVSIGFVRFIKQLRSSFKGPQQA